MQWSRSRRVRVRTCCALERGRQARGRARARPRPGGASTTRQAPSNTWTSISRLRPALRHAVAVRRSGRASRCPSRRPRRRQTIALTAWRPGCRQQARVVATASQCVGRASCAWPTSPGAVISNTHGSFSTQAWVQPCAAVIAADSGFEDRSFKAGLPCPGSVSVSRKPRRRCTARQTCRARVSASTAPALDCPLRHFKLAWAI